MWMGVCAQALNSVARMGLIERMAFAQRDEGISTWILGEEHSLQTEHAEKRPEVGTSVHAGVMGRASVQGESGRHEVREQSGIRSPEPVAVWSHRSG